MPLGTGPYDVALDEATHTAFVSLWGGLFVSVGIVRTTASCPSTSPIRRRRRGGDVIHTDKSPEQAIVVGGKLYVADADGDSVAAIDPRQPDVVADADGDRRLGPARLVAERARRRR